MSSDPTGPDDVKDHLNFIESLVSGASSTDEYLEAMIRNQAVMISLMEGGGANVPDVGEFGVPANTAGIVIVGASEGDYAEFLYKVDGRTIVEEFRTYSDIQSGEVAVINSDGLLEPTTDVDQGDLDFGNVATSLSNAGTFKYEYSEENVTVNPGNRETVLEVEISGASGLRMVGTNDEQETLYQYKIDGEKLLTEPIPSPLGLYNNMYEFPEPIKVNNSVEVVVIKPEKASGPNDYYSNMVLQ